MDEQKTDRLLTAREVADMLRVSYAFVLREVRDDAMPYIRLGAHTLRFRSSEIAAWMKAHAGGFIEDEG